MSLERNDFPALGYIPELDPNYKDPHEKCQECYYNYPYVLRRILAPDIEYGFQIHTTVGDSSAERSWKDALLLRKVPLLETEEHPFPKLSYLAKLTLWETYHEVVDLDRCLNKLCISDVLKKELIQFIKDENKSSDKHLRNKFKELLFSPDFLNELATN